jgi:AraC-like DNA-binding protein
VTRTEDRPLPQTCALPPVVWILREHVCYIGPDLGVDMHDAAVTVLSIGLDDRLTLETNGHGTITARSALVPARVLHRVIAPAGQILLLFIEPARSHTEFVGAAMRRYAGPYGLHHRQEDELVAAGRAYQVDRVVALATSRADDLDWRIRRVTTEIRDDPRDAFRADAVSTGLGLSTSHFLRLFAAETGTTFRRYQQWARLLYAVKGMLAGHDLTRCAVDAGFASLSHYTDTFHRTFGMAPSAALIKSSLRLYLESQLPGDPCWRS